MFRGGNVLFIVPATFIFCKMISNSCPWKDKKPAQGDPKTGQQSEAKFSCVGSSVKQHI